MATNREYTGLVLTPSSMAFLIRSYAAILGKIKHKTKRIKCHREELRELKKQLDAVAVVIALHEVTLNPEVIRPVRPTRARIGPHGEMARFLITALKEADGNPVSTTQLAFRFLMHLDMEVTMFVLKDLRSRVAWRLKDMAKEGRVVARHVPNERKQIIEGYWSFPQVDSAN